MKKLSTIKLLLQRVLGLSPKSEIENNREEFADLFGVWSESDFKEFEEKVKVFDEVE